MLKNYLASLSTCDSAPELKATRPPGAFAGVTLPQKMSYTEHALLHIENTLICTMHR